MRFIEVDGGIYVEDGGKMLPLHKDWLTVWAAMGEVQLLKEVMARRRLTEEANVEGCVCGSN